MFRGHSGQGIKEVCEKVNHAIQQLSQTDQNIKRICSLKTPDMTKLENEIQSYSALLIQLKKEALKLELRSVYQVKVEEVTSKQNYSQTLILFIAESSSRWPPDLWQDG